MSKTVAIGMKHFNSMPILSKINTRFYDSICDLAFTTLYIFKSAIAIYESSHRIYRQFLIKQ